MYSIIHTVKISLLRRGEVCKKRNAGGTLAGAVPQVNFVRFMIDKKSVNVYML